MTEILTDNLCRTNPPHVSSERRKPLYSQFQQNYSTQIIIFHEIAPNVSNDDSDYVKWLNNDV